MAAKWVADPVAEDHLTGVLDGRSWELALFAENDRCRRHDADAAVVVVSVDTSVERHVEARNTLLRDCAAAIRGAVRAHDIVARPRPNEIALLAVAVGDGAASAVEQRISRLLADAGIRATVGAVRRADVGGLDTACVAARQRMLRRRDADSAGWA